MNLQILKWLVGHRDLLAKVLEAVRGYHKDLPAIEQWDVVDRVARLVIPELTETDIRSLQSIAWEHADAVEAMQIGADYAALGVDWQLLLKILLPMLQIILDALATE